MFMIFQNLESSLNLENPAITEIRRVLQKPSKNLAEMFNDLIENSSSHHLNLGAELEVRATRAPG